MGIMDKLASQFVVANLGASGDADYKAPPALLRTMTVVELDGGAQPIQTSDKYHQKIRISEFVSGRGGPRTFYERAFWGCCGLSAARDEVVERYGLEAFYRVNATRQVSTRPLTEVLAEKGIRRVDFLKTDLEGIDFEVLKSVQELLPETLAVQCELRFEPLYADEPPADEVLPFLRKLGFELVGLRPEYWKPKHPDWGAFVDGNVAWGDFFFMRSAPSVIALAEKTGDALPLAKHIFLSVMFGKINHALRLLYTYKDRLGDAQTKEVVEVVNGFLSANPAYFGSPVLANFPHLSDPTVNVR